ncbi:MAG: alkaline phosphatase family protein [Deltaproteobacteria bacterium]|nr:alkaline phosphatase family protein [Deltaproteobacteria bacterium]
MKPFDRGIFILFDGARPDVFQEMLDAGLLPNLLKHLLPEGKLRTAVAAYPTVSGPAHLAFMTGCHPGTLNVPGIYWFDRQAYGRSRLGIGGFRTYLGPFKIEKMNSDVAPDTPTLADVWPDAAIVFGWYTRGLPGSALLTRWTKAASFVRGLITKDWLQCDRDAEVKLDLAVESGASMIFAVFPSADEMGHLFGPTSKEVRDAYLNLDRMVGKLFDRLSRRGEADRTVVMVASDHGQSRTHTHFPLDRFISSRLGPTMIYKRFITPLTGIENVVFPSGNGMANVHFKGRGWTEGRPDLGEARYQDLIKDLIKEDAIDSLAWRDADGWIVVLGKQGRARLREDRGKDGKGFIEYEALEGEPFGYADLGGRMSFEEVLRATFDTDYPDAPVSLATLMRSPRSGDLIVNATLGYDLRDWWEYQEAAGSHGALHREHAQVTVLTNVPLAEGPMRTVDVYPTLAALMGRPVPAGVEGSSRA